MMHFFLRAPGQPRTLAVLAGSFNPPTRAHLALAQAALSEADEVLLVLPRVFPHKPYEGASFEQRIGMLRAATTAETRFSIGASGGGLFIEIARECRDAYGTGVELFFLCGRDAAERIVNWDYGRPGAIAEQFREYGLLVAPRAGVYEPPPEFGAHVRKLCLEPEYSEISSTEVRERIRRGEPWAHLVPPEIEGLVRRFYS
jgi:nicotinate-nucleotide adenylyltransferase